MYEEGDRVGLVRRVLAGEDPALVAAEAKIEVERLENWKTLFVEAGSASLNRRPSDQLRYKAFLSYSHRDKIVARRFHRALERYRLPPAPGRPGRSLGKFFFDEYELAAASKIGPAIRGALDDSESLVLLGSGASASSPFVADEVQHFLRRDETRIFVVALDPFESREDLAQLVSPPLRPRMSSTETVPLVVQPSQDGFERAVVRLAAGLSECDFDSLWQRERRRARRRRGIQAGAVFALVISAFVGLSSVQRAIDVRELAAFASTRAEDGWQSAWRPRFFEPAFRSALAALPLPYEIGLPPSDPPRCDLGENAPSPSCIFRRSGLAVPSRLIWGQRPKGEQSNVRPDIDDSSNHERRTLFSPLHVRRLTISGNGRRLAMLESQRVTVAEVPTGAVVSSTVTQANAVALDTDGRHLALALPRSLVEVDVGTWRARNIWPLRRFRPLRLEHFRSQWLLFDSQRLLRFPSADRGGATRSSAPEGQPIVSSDVYNPRPLAVRTGKAVVFGDDGDATIQSVDLADKRSRAVTHAQLAAGVGQVKATAVSPSGSLLVLGGNGSGSTGRDGGQVVRTSDGSEQARLRGHAGEIYAAAFGSDDETVVTGGSDFSVRVWQASQGRESLRLIGHVAPVSDLVVDPFGQWFASASQDGTVRVWTLPAGFDSSDRDLRNAHCDHQNEHPNTVFTRAERSRLRAAQGRPWDVCEWAGLGSLEGWRQALVVALVRWFRLSSVDYGRPDSTVVITDPNS